MLTSGSLQTFLNAFTYPDRTCYPVASMNTKDFYNLIHVYLDAVLYPRAVSDPLVLQQEGWHYELEDPSQPLTYKGVVYNEMKGVYSSPDSLMGRYVASDLFDDILNPEIVLEQPSRRYFPIMPIPLTREEIPRRFLNSLLKSSESFIPSTTIPPTLEFTSMATTIH